MTETPAQWRTMYDSAGPAGIPDDAPMVASYVDGGYEWPADQVQRFAGVPHPRITVEPFDAAGRPTGYPFGNYRQASIIDVETGAFSVANAARFVPARNRLHPGTATLYCNKFTYMQTARRGLRGHDYWLWVAWFVNHVPSEAEVAELYRELGIAPDGTGPVRLAAWQHTNGSAYDESAVFTDQWHGGK